MQNVSFSRPQDLAADADIESDDDTLDDFLDNPPMESTTSKLWSRVVYPQIDEVIMFMGPNQNEPCCIKMFLAPCRLACTLSVCLVCLLTGVVGTPFTAAYDAGKNACQKYRSDRFFGPGPKPESMEEEEIKQTTPLSRGHAARTYSYV